MNQVTTNAEKLSKMTNQEFKKYTSEVFRIGSGARRSGKTFMQLQIQQDLMKELERRKGK